MAAAHSPILQGRLIPPTLALMAGIAATAYLPLPLLPAAALLLAAAGGGGLLLVIKKPGFGLHLALLTVFFLAGYLLATPHTGPPPSPQHLYNQLYNPLISQAGGPDEQAPAGDEPTLEQRHDLVLVGTLRQLPVTVQQHRTFGRSARLKYTGYEAPGRLPESAALLNGYAPLNRQINKPGEQLQLPRQSGQRTRLLLAVEEYRQPAAPPRPAHGLVQLTVNGRLNKTFRPGDRLMVRAEVGPVRAFRVPGAFDYRRFLAHQGVLLSGWVAAPVQVAGVYQQEQADHPLPLAGYQRLKYFPERARFAAGQLLEEELAGHPRLPLLKALLIGERGGIDAAEMESFKAAGAMHLLAISGMHLGMVALLAAGGAYWLLKRSARLLLALDARKVSLLLALPPVIGYALITGLNPPAQRALIMTLVFMAAILSNRQWCSLNNLALAALLILALDPAALLGASFQLSFGATAGIIILAPHLQQHYRELELRESGLRLLLRQVIFWVLTSLLVSAVATLVTAPLVLHHFHRISLLSPLSTLLATPLIFFWTLPLALAGLALSGLGLAGGGLLLNAAAGGLNPAVAIIAWLAALPGSFFYLPPPSPAQWLSWLALFAILAMLQQRYRRRASSAPGAITDDPAQKARAHGAPRPATFSDRLPATRLSGQVAAALPAIPILLLLLLPPWHQWERGRLSHSRVTFIEVGHGNATVIEMPGNRTILVDGGGPATLSTDVGEQLIAPWLRHQRIRRLEAVVISHPHADHYNGIPFLLRHFRPQTLWVNGHTENQRDYEELLELAEELGVEIRVPTAGEVLAKGADFALVNLGNFHQRPTASFQPPLEDRVNDQSLIISYRHQDFSLLLPGDIYKGQERRLISEMATENRNPGHLILAASHHGRATSMDPEFISAISPAWIAVSDDQRRTDYRRVAKWQQTGATVLTTGRHGTITCDNRQQPACSP